MPDSKPEDQFPPELKNPDPWPGDPNPNSAFPFFLRHPIMWMGDVVEELVSTIETYTTFPMSLALGGIAIYYLRKS
jgi:hypothetical protein